MKRIRTKACSLIPYYPMTPLVRACGIPSQLTDPWTSGQGQSQHIEIDAGSAVLAVSFSANDKHLVRGDKREFEWGGREISGKHRNQGCQLQEGQTLDQWSPV